MKITLPLLICLLAIGTTYGQNTIGKRDKIMADSARSYLYRQSPEKRMTKIDSIALLQTELVSEDHVLKSYLTQSDIDIIKANTPVDYDKGMIEANKAARDLYLLVPYKDKHSHQARMAEYNAQAKKDNAQLRADEKELAKCTKFHDSLAMRIAKTDTTKKDCYLSKLHIVATDTANAKQESDMWMLFDQHFSVVSSLDAKYMKN